MALAAVMLALALTLATAPPEPIAPVAPVGDILEVDKDFDIRMTVPVTINGRGPFRFVVDTGANRTVVSSGLAQSLNLPPGPKLRVHGAVASADAGSVKIADLQVGSRHVHNVVAPVLLRADIGAAGILGVDALRDQRVVLDLRAGSMSVAPSVAEPLAPGEVVVRGQNRLGQLVFVDAKANGENLYVVLDTGGEMTIGNSALRKVMERRRKQVASRMGVLSVTGDTATAELSAAPRIHLGGATIVNAPIAYADLAAFNHFRIDGYPSMLLGMNVLRAFEKVTIDFKRREVRLILKGGG